MRLIESARKRRVTAVVAWYLVAAWAVIQVADVVGPPLGFPAATVRYLIYTALALLPMAVLLPWFRNFEPARPKVVPAKLVEGRPISAEAYDAYQRANHIATQVLRWQDAVALYRECLRHDAAFAPAWARIGRCYRIAAKFDTQQPDSSAYVQEAIAAFDKALALSPDLPLTHALYAQLEIDLGRPEDAMVRLLARADVGAADADIFAGLVQAFRFVGLLGESIAAHEKARALDANVRTGVTHTYFMLARYDDALKEYRNADIGYVEASAMAMLGRSEEAIALLRMRDSAPSVLGMYLTSLRALLENDREEALRNMPTPGSELAGDTEMCFHLARQYAYLGADHEALAALEITIQRGFVCPHRLQTDPWLDGIRESAGFRALLRAAQTRHEQAREAFLAANGASIMGAHAPARRG